MRGLIARLGQVKTTLVITLVAVMVSMAFTAVLMSALAIPGIDTGLMISALAPLLVAPLVSWNVVGLLLKLNRLEQEQRVLATTDQLTGVLARREFLRLSDLMLDRVEREGDNLGFSIALLDLDKFKSINDSYGHAAGDEVLIHFGALLQQVSRGGEVVVGRLGGEEFALALLSDHRAEAELLLEDLRAQVAASEVIYLADKIGYTVSMGAIRSDLPDQDALKDLLVRADRALYRAKRSGRNRVCWFE